MSRKQVDPNKVIGELGRLKASQVSRRQFCGLGLVTPAFGLPGPRNIRRRHQDTVIYRGPMRLPDEVVRLAYQQPVLKTTHSKMAVKVSHGNVSYVLRVVGGRDYLGEIVRTQDGILRVHVWTIVDGPMPTVEEIVARKTQQ
jgi:hypothetical protein